MLEKIIGNVRVNSAVDAFKTHAAKPDVTDLEQEKAAYTRSSVATSLFWVMSAGAGSFGFFNDSNGLMYGAGGLILMSWAMHAVVRHQIAAGFVEKLQASEKREDKVLALSLLRKKPD